MKLGPRNVKEGGWRVPGARVKNTWSRREGRSQRTSAECETSGDMNTKERRKMTVAGEESYEVSCSLRVERRGCLGIEHRGEMREKNRFTGNWELN